VTGHVEREADRRRERGLRAAGLAGSQPLDREAELPPVLEELLELLGLVAVAGDDERPVEVQLDAELGAEAGEAVERAEPDAEQRGGADLIQLRDKSLSDEELIEAAKTFRAAADAHGALFILNDRPDLVEACDADGVHVGQDDGTPAQARAAIGPDRIVGRS